MDRNEMIEGIMKTAGLTKANVDRFYDGLVDLVKKRLASDGEFVLPGLGALKVRVRKAREALNPVTRQKISVPRKKVVRFVAYRELKELLNPGLAADAQAPAAPATPPTPPPPAPQTSM